MFYSQNNPRMKKPLFFNMAYSPKHIDCEALGWTQEITKFPSQKHSRTTSGLNRICDPHSFDRNSEQLHRCTRVTLTHCSYRTQSMWGTHDARTTGIKCTRQKKTCVSRHVLLLLLTNCLESQAVKLHQELATFFHLTKIWACNGTLLTGFHKIGRDFNEDYEEKSLGQNRERTINCCCHWRVSKGHERSKRWAPCFSDERSPMARCHRTLLWAYQLASVFQPWSCCRMRPLFPSQWCNGRFFCPESGYPPRAGRWLHSQSLFERWFSLVTAVMSLGGVFFGSFEQWRLAVIGEYVHVGLC